MNPSAHGWTLKLSHELDKARNTWSDAAHLTHFQSQTGFLYGAHLRSWEKLQLPALTTTDEIAKVNLFISLYGVASQHSVAEFQSELGTFYSDLGLGASRKNIEKLIDSRIYLGGGLFKKSMGTSMTNVLLYLDVLLFEQFVKGQPIAHYAPFYEHIVLDTIHEAASLHKTVDKKHFKIAKLLEDSRAFRSSSGRAKSPSPISDWPANLSQYALRMAAVTLWEREGYSERALDLLYTKGADFKLSEEIIHQLLNEVDLFYTSHYTEIPYLKHYNLVYNYYEGITKTAGRLIYRNRDRIKRELRQNKELIRLISKSTQTELTAKEKEQMKAYLLDSFKSIPSIALFLLPGGSVLLPVIASLLPKLLPSSFDENRID
jgi:hypothetical protein